MLETDTNGRKHERKFDRSGFTVAQDNSGLSEAENRQVQTWTISNSRDELLRTSINFGLSLTQTYHFSMSWPEPFKQLSRVSERKKALGLRPLFHKRARKRTPGHNDSINKCFIRLVGRFMQCGFSLGPVTRETKASEIVLVRPDFSFVVTREKEWQFYCEIQSSNSSYTSWKQKLRQYVKLREETGQFFKILVMPHNTGEMRRAKAGARAALREHEGLNIFQFALLEDVLTSDAVRDQIWESCWPKSVKDSLLK